MAIKNNNSNITNFTPQPGNAGLTLAIIHERGFRPVTSLQALPLTSTTLGSRSLGRSKVTQLSLNLSPPQFRHTNLEHRANFNIF
ncbi:hypothetical protein RRG08_047568 [Elysia crispata]|uniref:Uncharacterized protein n=1 Tax=Elysia crispata TaxID=231223 RepID=A0AAE0YNP1_9GAST|nr:hypothetical protein RRG08_047568 [Elysia crispata]